MSNAKIDQNSRATLIALSSDGLGNIVTLYADPTTHRLLIDDPNGGTVNSIGITTANGVSGVSSGGFDPRLTITLGAITPSSVTATGAIKSATSIILEDPGVGTKTVTLQAPTLPGNLILTLPTAYPAVTGYVLSATDAGVMSWVDNAAASGANVNLSNITAVDASANIKFMVSDGGTYTIGTKNATAAATGGDNLIIIAGNGKGVAPGGTITITGGSGGTTTTGGAGAGILIQGGNAGGSGANAGGNIELVPGVKTGAGANGIVYIQDPTSSIQAQFNTATLATTNKVFTFPNHDLTFDNITTSTTTNGTGYLKGNGTVISFDNSALVSSVTTANGVSAVNSSGALTFTLGAITPTTVNGLTVGLGLLAENTNIAIGVNALDASSAGSSGNVAIGYNSLTTETDGTNNTAIGVASLQTSNGGVGNTAIGSGASFSNTTGDYNTVVGRAALYFNQTGSSNIAIGYNAGKYETGSNAFYVDNQNRTNTAGDKAGALLYGTFNATPASQTLAVNGSLTVKQPLFFGTTPTVGAFTLGKEYFCTTNQTLCTEIGYSQTLPLGEMELRQIYNATGSTILKGSAVYTDGVYSGGTNNVATIALAQANNVTTSSVLGLASADILTASYGFITVRGTIDLIDTNAYSVSDVIYLSDSTPGGWTIVRPSSPSYQVRLGRIITKGDITTGRINVRLIQSFTLDNLSDVTITTPAVDQILKYNGTNWINGAAVTSSASNGIQFFNTTPTILPKILPLGITQAGSAGNGIQISHLSKTPIISLSSTVTISHASPAVVTWNAHGLPYGCPIVFTTNGALPAPLVAGTTYYVLDAATGYGANTFEISTTQTGGAINTTNDGSGTHTATVGEITETLTANNDTRLATAWLYDTALGRTTIDAGTWVFTLFASVDNTTRATNIYQNIYQVVPAASGTVTTTNLGANTKTATITSHGFAGTYFSANATNTVASYLQTPEGIFQISAIADDNTCTIIVPTGYTNENAVTFNVWNKLFGSSGMSITSSSVSQYDSSISQGAFTIALTDKLGQFSFMSNTNTTTVTLYYNGANHSSHFSTPLITLHNNLAGLQGGTATDRWHLSASEGTVTGTGNLVRDTSPIFTTPNIGSATGSITGNAGTATYASAVTVTDEHADTTSFPLFTSDAVGNLVPHTNSGITFDAHNYNLTTTTFTGALAGNASSVTNATLTTALTVNGGATTLTGNVGGSTLTLGVGASSVSGANTGDNSANSTYTTLATTIATANAWTATQTQYKITYTNNPIAGSAANPSLATVPITYSLSTVTNGAANALTITMTTASAVDGMTTMVRILDASAAAQTLAWVNTENSNIGVPTTTNGSTTLFLTVGFMFNGGTSLWRCIAVA